MEKPVYNYFKVFSSLKNKQIICLFLVCKLIDQKTGMEEGEGNEEKRPLGIMVFNHCQPPSNCLSLIIRA